MNKIDDTLIASTFQKVKNSDIFAFKAYIEPTATVNQSSVWAMLTDIFVNMPFYVLNSVVGIFSLIIRFFDDFSLYKTYRQTVFNTSKILWKSLVNGGDYRNSLLYLLLAFSLLSIFLSFAVARGNYVKRLLHLMLVLMLGMGYFGTIQGTSGGVYVLDTVHEVADVFGSKVSKLSISDPENSKKQISQKYSVADQYVMKTSYEAYLFVNTGQLNAKYHNNKNGKEEFFDNKKVLGEKGNNGKFIQSKIKERQEYLNDRGQGGAEGQEENRWVSAVGDYLWIKCGYVIFKIFEAIVLAVPLILIKLIALVADIVVIILMFIFPLALLVSFLPKMQDVVINVVKTMLGAVSFPALTGFLILIVFYIQSLIGQFIKQRFENLKLLSNGNFSGQSLLFILMITVVIQGFVFFFVWKYRMRFLTFVVGSKAAQVVNETMTSVVDKANDLGMNRELYEKAHDMSALTFTTAGAGAGYMLGTVMRGKDLWSAFKKNQVESGSDLSSDFGNIEGNSDYDAVFGDEINERRYDGKDSNLNRNVNLENITDNASLDIEEPNLKEADFKLNYDDNIDGVNNLSIKDNMYSSIDYYNSDSVLDTVEKSNSNIQDNFNVIEDTDKGFRIEEISDFNSNGQQDLEVNNESQFSSKTQKKVSDLESELGNYSSVTSFYKSHAKTSFGRSYDKARGKNHLVKKNLERRNFVMEQLEQLRGG